MKDTLAEHQLESMLMDDVATITAGQIRLFIPIGEEIVEQFLPLAKKMKK
ncbi:hypothetical protein [uncultured Cloacibacillus sp.]|nr:hypothetical protein [uncultured Cloacibacillus sp.]